MKRHMFILPALVIALVLTVPTGARADTSSQPVASAPSPGAWNPVHVFIGTWTGVKTTQGTSKEEASKITRKYETAVNSVQVTDRSGKSDREPAGAIRLDSGKGRLVLGYQGSSGKSDLVHEPAQSTDTRLVFVGLENNPGQTRVTYERLSWNEFIERVEYAPQGKEFSLVSETRFKRKS